MVSLIFISLKLESSLTSIISRLTYCVLLFQASILFNQLFPTHPELCYPHVLIRCNFFSRQHWYHFSYFEIRHPLLLFNNSMKFSVCFLYRHFYTWIIFFLMGYSQNKNSPFFLLMSITLFIRDEVND